jgi:hypothetical protein
VPVQRTNLPPLLDEGNNLLSTDTLSTMVTGIVQVDGGVCGILTIRTQSTTLTLPIKTRQEAQNWVDAMTAVRDAFTESGLVVAQPPGLVTARAGQMP